MQDNPTMTDIQLLPDKPPPSLSLNSAIINVINVM